MERLGAFRNIFFSIENIYNKANLEQKSIYNVPRHVEYICIDREKVLFIIFFLH